MISDLFLYGFHELAAEYIIGLTALVILLLDCFATGKSARQTMPYISVLGSVIALVVLFAYQAEHISIDPTKMLVFENIAMTGQAIILLGVALVSLLSPAFLKGSELDSGEYYLLILLSAMGMMLLTSVNDLLMVFLGIELMSIPIYVLIGMRRKSSFSGEASLKYFILGAFASGFLLFGIALTYRVFGSTNLATIAQNVGHFSGDHTLLIIALTMLLVGFGFKVAAVPFHMWAPDVYQGAPVSITAFMSVTVKTAAFITLLRIFSFALAELHTNWQPVLWVLSVLSMILGNLLAIKQDNIKRMLAYSTIAHTGYILVGVVAGTKEGSSAVIYYLISYFLLNFAAFAVVILLSTSASECEEIEDFKGIGYKYPILGVIMTVSMLGLVGIPPTAGFFAKFYIFSAAVKAGYIWLVVLGVIASAISIYYYLRVLVYMYMKDPAADAKALPESISPVALVVLSILTIAVFYVGLTPSMSPWN